MMWHMSPKIFAKNVSVRFNIDMGVDRIHVKKSHSIMKIAIIVFSGLVFLVPAQGVGFFDKVFEGLGSFGLSVPNELSEDKVIAGLKEALEVGTANAVNLTGATNGFLQNEAIKIAMPAQLQKLDQALRLVG